jgi:hypothetical protein
MNTYVTYNAQYKVLICREHMYGVNPDHLSRHLRDSHKSIPLAMRNAIVDYSKTLDLAAPENIDVVGETAHAIEGLTATNVHTTTVLSYAAQMGR